MKKYIEIKYFCKSRQFLYPILELAKHDTEEFKPKGVYLFFEDHSIEKGELILLYGDIDVFFSNYERKKLIKHNRIRKVYETDKGNVYIFDVSDYKQDIDLLLCGEYSKFSNRLKSAILRYNKDKADFKKLEEGRYMHAVLYPEHYREAVSEELGVDVKNLTELAPLYDLEKETLYATIKDRNVGEGDTIGVGGFIGSD